MTKTATAVLAFAALKKAFERGFFAVWLGLVLLWRLLRWSLLSLWGLAAWTYSASRGTIQDRRYRELSRIVWDGKPLEHLHPFKDMARLRKIWSPSIGIRLSALPYQQFLKTYYWRTIRTHLIYVRGHTCQRCGIGTLPLELHHKEYKGLVGFEHRMMNRLTLLCRECHGSEHTGVTQIWRQ